MYVKQDFRGIFKGLKYLFFLANKLDRDKFLVIIITQFLSEEVGDIFSDAFTLCMFI